MYFISDTAPITLHTDASDYGVGGYSFQTVDGANQPIAFVPKSSAQVLNFHGQLYKRKHMEFIIHACIWSLC